MKTYQVIWRLVRFSPGTFLAALLFSVAVFGLPVPLGLVTRAFFDTLTGHAPMAVGLGSVIALFVAVEIADVVTGKLDVRAAAAALPDMIEEPDASDEMEQAGPNEEEIDDTREGDIEEAAATDGAGRLQNRGRGCAAHPLPPASARGLAGRGAGAPPRRPVPAPAPVVRFWAGRSPGDGASTYAIPAARARWPRTRRAETGAHRAGAGGGARRALPGPGPLRSRKPRRGGFPGRAATAGWPPGSARTRPERGSCRRRSRTGGRGP